jgi:hypothetical protein
MNDVDDLCICPTQIVSQQSQGALEYVGAGSLDRRVLAVALCHRDLLAVLFVITKAN